MEVLKLSIQEALITMFTDDPVNWLKWAVVFAVLIGGYAVAVPLYKKVSHGMSWERPFQAPGNAAPVPVSLLCR